MGSVVSVALSANAYAPNIGQTCPSGSLVRAASGLYSAEETYRTGRKAIADEALVSWLETTSSDFGTDGTLPAIGLTSAGGGLRATLSSAGAVKGFDKRDTSNGVSGVYQALTYHTGLSGGGWMLSSMAGNNWPTISYLQENLWNTAFEDTLFIPSDPLVAYAAIDVDIVAKGAQGFDTTITDLWGRLLSYQLLEGSDGGVSKTMSGLTAYSNFTDYNAPFPIILAVGDNTWSGACSPSANGSIYELSPYEFGSWDPAISAFIQMKYLGTSLTNGKPANSKSCVTNFDNLGFELGTSSNLFNDLLCEASGSAVVSVDWYDQLTELSAYFNTTDDTLYATYPNPFYKYASTTATSGLENSVSAHEKLYLVDGGETYQDNPIWPLLRSERDVSVLLVNDLSGDSDEGWPNGSQLRQTYEEAVIFGYDNMPFIPETEVFESEGLTTTAQFFGCNDTSVITLVWLPNADWTYASNTSTTDLQYTTAETTAMIDNGVQVASQGDDAEWPVCLGCAIMHKTSNSLPEECTACLEKYCYYA